MTKFTYNNVKNINIGYIFFKLNYNFYLKVFYRKNVNFYSKSKLIDKLIAKLKDLVFIHRKNLYYSL